MRTRGPIAIALLMAGVPVAADAADYRCRGRVTLAFGETKGDIARRCGITVEALDRSNPGLSNDPRMGTSIAVPAPALPARQQGVNGNPYVPTPPPRGNFYVPVPTPPGAIPSYQNY